MKKSTQLIFVGFLVFVNAGMGLALWHRHDQASAPLIRDVPSEMSSPIANDVAPQPPHRSQRTSASLPSPSPATEIVFNETLSSEIKLGIFQFYGHDLDRELIEAFELSEKEQTEVKDSFDQLRFDIMDLRSENTRIEKEGSQLLRATIAPFSSEAEIAYERHLTRLHQTLDPVRSEALAKLSRSGIKENLKGFGDEKDVYEISLTAAPDSLGNEKPRLKLTRIFPPGGNVASYTSGGTLEILEHSHPGIPSLFPSELIANLEPTE